MKRRRLPRLAALLTAGVIAAVALVSLASAGFVDANYSSIAGTDLSTPHPVSNASLTPDCGNIPPAIDADFDPENGEVLWHFILNQTDATSGLLRADFTTAGLTSPDVQDFPSASGVLHWYVITPAADTLEDASTDAVGERLNLSHVCYQQKLQPTVVTALHDPDHGPIANGSELDLGSIVHDSATVTGGGATPTGTVTFTFYSEENCGGAGAGAGTVALVNGVAHPSNSTLALAPGSYGFKANYSGDEHYFPGGSDCEPFSVKKGQLEAATKLHSPDPDHDVIPNNTALDLGSKLHDTAQITGAVDGFAPSGAVTFTFYEDYEACDDSGSAVDNIGADEDTGDPRTADTAALGAGNYAFRAEVAGDQYYEGDVSECEPFSVKKAQLTIVTAIHNSTHGEITNTTVPVGTVVHDTATVTGAVAGFPIPAISFTLNGNAVSNAISAEVGFSASTVDSAPLTAGSYIYKASVAGDDNYIGGGSPDEPLSVRTLGKTMGFWGNPNGQALLPANPGVTLGTVSATTCSIVVSTKAISKVILPTTKNGVTILTNCTTTQSRDSINTDSLNTLLAQTLAISFNILYINGYTGQTVGGLGCTADGIAALSPLTNASTVQDVRDRANYLIANAKSGAPTITQAQVGAMNTLLGCLNREV